MSTTVENDKKNQRHAKMRKRHRLMVTLDLKWLILETLSPSQTRTRDLSRVRVLQTRKRVLRLTTPSFRGGEMTRAGTGSPKWNESCNHSIHLQTDFIFKTIVVLLFSRWGWFQTITAGVWILLSNVLVHYPVFDIFSGVEFFTRSQSNIGGRTFDFWRGLARGESL